MTPAEEKLYAKIAKLTTLAEGAQEIGSMEEAASVQAKIAELVLEYNLDLSKVPGKKQNAEVIIEKYQVKFNKTESDWIPILLHTIATHNMGKVVILNKGNEAALGSWLFDIIGEKVNIDLIEYIFEQLIPRIKSMRAASFKKALITENPGLKKNGYFRAYSREVVKAINWKLAAERESMAAKYEGGSGLIVVKDAAIQAKVQETYGRLRQAKSSNLGNAHGARDGKRDGHSMQINKGLN